MGCSLNENTFNILSSVDYRSREGTMCIGKVDSSTESNVFVLSEKVRTLMLYQLSLVVESFLQVE